MKTGNQKSDTLAFDSANNYQNGDSEQWLGEWMKARGNRDEIVLATKYTSPFRTYTKKGIQANYIGNNAKSLKTSVEASLKNLQTDYIDLVRAIKQGYDGGELANET